VKTRMKIDGPRAGMVARGVMFLSDDFVERSTRGVEWRGSRSPLRGGRGVRGSPVRALRQRDPVNNNYRRVARGGEGPRAVCIALQAAADDEEEEEEEDGEGGDGLVPDDEPLRISMYALRPFVCPALSRTRVDGIRRARR